jgi:hypothetical protein
MRPVILCASALALCSAPAIAAKFTMQLNAGAQQTARMEGGVAAVDDTTAGSSVRLVQAEGDLKKRGSVGVVVMNQTDKPFNFGPENITAKLVDGTVIAIITYEQLVKEEKRRQTWAAIAAGLSAAGNSMSAANSGYYSGYGTYHGSTYGSFGSTPFNATTTGTVMVSGYDYGRAQAAQSIANAQNQATFARMADQNAANMRALKTYMRTTTVDPQQMFGGSVTFELPKAARGSKTDLPITFVVTINGEEHKFDAVLRRR